LIIIKIHNFSDGIHELEFDESVRNLGLEEPFYDAVLCKIVMDKSSSQIVIKGEISAKAHLTCDRCNDEFDRVFTSDFKNVYLFSSNAEENDTENIIYLNRETDKIDLTDDLKEYAILSVPMKILCSDDCKGLCFKCGANLNYENCSCEKTAVNNSVWAALDNLKNKLEN
jgi:uncharacterized protein